MTLRLSAFCDGSNGGKRDQEQNGLAIYFHDFSKILEISNGTASMKLHQPC
jgi:hypothetical protein